MEKQDALSIAIQKKGTRYYARIIALCIIVFKQSIMTYISAFVGKIAFLSGFSQALTPILLMFFVILGIDYENRKRIRFGDLLVPFFVVFGIVATAVSFPTNLQYIEFNFWTYIFYCIPAFFIGVSFVDLNDESFSVMVKVSYIAIALSFVVLLYYGFEGVDVGEDAMSLSYPVLVPLMLIISHFFHKHSKISFVFIIVGLLYMFMMGTRGPILIALAFILFSFVQQKKHKVLVSIVTIGLLLLFLESNLFDDTLALVKNIVSKTGYSTRVIDAMMEGTIVEDASRDALYTLLLADLREKPWTGYGLFGEWHHFGWNAHNIYLEVVYEYGWFIGVALIAFYLAVVIRALFKTKNAYTRIIISIFVFFVLVQGVRGYSHLRPETFLLLGVCTKENRKKGSDVVNEQERTVNCI